MQRFTEQEKAIIYNDLLFKYRKLEEEISHIRSKNFEVSEEDQKRIDEIEYRMKSLEQSTKKLYL